MKEKEIILPEGAEIKLRVPVNTENTIIIEILADEKPYAMGTIIPRTTGTFSFGVVKCAKGKRKGIVLKPSFNFSLINTNVTGISTD